MDDPAMDFFEGHCGDCQDWRESTAYLTKGRTCRNEKSPNYGQTKNYLDTCSFHHRKE
jgi:hypothetical protein